MNFQPKILSVLNLEEEIKTYSDKIKTMEEKIEVDTQTVYGLKRILKSMEREKEKLDRILFNVPREKQES